MLKNFKKFLNGFSFNKALFLSFTLILLNSLVFLYNSPGLWGSIFSHDKIFLDYIKGASLRFSLEHPYGILFSLKYFFDSFFVIDEFPYFWQFGPDFYLFYLGFKPFFFVFFFLPGLLIILPLITYYLYRNFSITNVIKYFFFILFYLLLFEPIFFQKGIIDMTIITDKYGFTNDALYYSNVLNIYLEHFAALFVRIYFTFLFVVPVLIASIKPAINSLINAFKTITSFRWKFLFSIFGEADTLFIRWVELIVLFFIILIPPLFFNILAIRIDLSFFNSMFFILFLINVFFMYKIYSKSSTLKSLRSRNFYLFLLLILSHAVAFYLMLMSMFYLSFPTYLIYALSSHSLRSFLTHSFLISILIFPTILPFLLAFLAGVTLFLYPLYFILSILVFPITQRIKGWFLHNASKLNKLLKSNNQ